MHPQVTYQQCDNTDRPFLSELHYYQAVARSLRRGHSPTQNGEKQNQGELQRRPPLPVELVLSIFRHAKIRNSHPSRELSFSWISDSEPAKVAASSWRTQRMPLFVSPPLDRSKLNKIASICLITESKDQGRWSPSWDHGSYSWFEFGIGVAGSQGPSDTDAYRWVPIDASQQEPRTQQAKDERGQFYLTEKKVEKDCLRWKSHSNVVASKTFRRHVGEEFKTEHDLLTQLDAGDRLVVWLCAQHPGWICEVKSATVCVWEWFEPTLF